CRLIPLIDFDLKFERSGDDERDVQALTQAMAASLEGFVRRFPEQWFAFRPVWPEKVHSIHSTPQPQKERWRVWALQAAVFIGERLPRRLAYGFAQLAGTLAYRFREEARADVEANMRHVMGPDAPAEQVRAAARRAFVSVARYYVDLIQLPRTGAGELQQR